MENYVKYKLVGGKLTLKKGVVPHKFECQKSIRNTIERQDIQYFERVFTKNVERENLVMEFHDCGEPEEQYDDEDRKEVFVPENTEEVSDENNQKNRAVQVHNTEFTKEKSTNTPQKWETIRNKQFSNTKQPNHTPDTVLTAFSSTSLKSTDAECEVSDTEIKVENENSFQSHMQTDQSESDEESNALDPDSELWGFFDKEPRNRAKCSMCGVRLSRDSDILYRHLKEKHSKISENLEFKDNDESYTEVIYLEDPVETPKVDKKPRFEQKVLSEVQPKAKRPSKRRYSSKEEFNSYQKPEQPLKMNKDEMEIENFGKYITVLLKDVTKSVCTKLQMDIVNLIMTAKLSNTEPTAPTITISSVVEEDREREKDVEERDENQENEESFTEVPITNESPFEIHKQGMDTSKSDTPPTKRPKRRFSYREEYTYKVNLTEKEEKEVENFGKYVTCLLKTVPHKDIGTRLQMEIVNLIMTARLKVMKKTSPVLTINGTIELQNKVDENSETAAFAED